MSKAIFVDGANLFAMREPLAISRYDFYFLYSVIVSVGEKGTLYEQPVFVVDQDREATYGKVLRSAGFDVVVAESEGSRDDAIIIERINNLPPEVTEIVIVSADQDYAPCLRQKVADGVRVWWVGTRVTQRNGRPMIAQSLEQLFENGTFIFKELNEERAKIMRRPWIDKRPRPLRHGEQTQTATQRLTITVEMGHAEVPTVLNALAKFLTDCPGSKFEFQDTEGLHEEAG